MEQQQQNGSKSVTVCIVMGPSGVGKTSIGQQLAHKLGAPFLEGDHFHLKASVEKMSNGIALTDEDRWPWLAEICRFCSVMASDLKKEGNAPSYIVVTCSCLKKSYRDMLRDNANVDRTVFIYPKGTFELIHSRISERKNHFMKPGMLDSQFAALESPEGEKDVICIEAALNIDSIIEQIINFLSPNDDNTH